MILARTNVEEVGQIIKELSTKITNDDLDVDNKEML